ncbi:MAG TPA: hypothetical protein PLY56_18445, partial [Armatimonadota bacterium]|nr:hypothetical protein [Armatimonadota bacterium]
MSLLSRISKGGGAPLPDPDRQPMADRLPTPDAPERLPAAGTSQPQATQPPELDGIVWRLMAQVGQVIAPSGVTSRNVERGERDQRMYAIEEHALPILQQEGISLTPTERTKVFSRLYDELFGLGPLESLLDDSTVRRIVVNGPREVLAERYSGLEKTDAAFKDDAHLVLIVRRIASLVEVPLDDSIPRMSATLQDGARVQAVL